MNTKHLFFVLLLFQSMLIIKSTCGLSIDNNQRTDTLEHNLSIVKPMLNFNDTNGGYYSEYIGIDLNHLYTSAVVQNMGQVSSTQVFLEINILEGYDEELLNTYFSDTIDVMLPNDIDTLKIDFNFSQNYKLSYEGQFKIVYTVRSSQIDNDTINNADTLFFELYNPDWVFVSRSVTPTGTLDVTKIDNFQSGDFIGITFELANNYHCLSDMIIIMNGDWPESASMKAKVYKNNELIISKPIINIWQDEAIVNLSNEFFYVFIPNELYYFGVEIDFADGDEIPIAIDTSAFHNFEFETVANINGNWSTLNFVPVIKLIFDPEGIDEKQKHPILLYIQIQPWAC